MLPDCRQSDRLICVSIHLCLFLLLFVCWHANSRKFRLVIDGGKPLGLISTVFWCFVFRCASNLLIIWRRSSDRIATDKGKCSYRTLASRGKALRFDSQAESAQQVVSPNREVHSFLLYLFNGVSFAVLPICWGYYQRHEIYCAM